MTRVFVGFINQKVKKEYQKAKYENPELYRFLERATLVGMVRPQKLRKKVQV